MTPVDPTAPVTLAAGAIAVPVLTAFGVPLGLRPDLLIAGFSGALVSIVLLNAVPSSGDTWQHLVRTTGRRMAVVVAGALTAGYLTPALLPDTTAVAWLLGAGFAVGAAAQRVLQIVIRRWFPDAPPPPPGAPPGAASPAPPDAPPAGIPPADGSAGEGAQ